MRASALYGQACDGGLAAGCAELGGMLEAGTEVEMNLGRAAELQAKACEGGVAGLVRPPRRDVRDRLADAARRPQGGGAPDPRLRCQRRRELRPPRRGHRRGQGHRARHRRAPPLSPARVATPRTCPPASRLANALVAGDRVPRDLPQAQAALHEGVRRRRARRLLRPRPDAARRQRRPRATRPARQSCSSAPATATSARRATTSRSSSGRPRPGARADLAQAALLLRQACTDGDPRGCVELGKLFQSGGAVQQDVNRAAALFEEACGKGALAGCSALAPMLEVGDRIGRNLPRAKELYARTCDGGIAADCYALGRILQRDSTTATASRVRGVLEGLRRGLRRRPATRSASRGRPGHDPKKALGFYQKACAAAQAASCERVKKLQ